jgi:hypothetical protein
MWFADPSTGEPSFGIGIGTIVLAVNVVLLSGYALGCHSMRHLIGGGVDLLTNNPARQLAYGCVSCLNRRHQRWAWLSLFWVAFSDVYVRLLAAGVFRDLRIL